MKNKGGVRSAMFIIATAGILVWGFCVHAVQNGDLVISQVQITGGTGKTSQDYISIYNKSGAVIDLNGLRLVKRTKTGTSDTTIKSWVSPTLLNPNAYHLWANSADGFASTLSANSESSQSIADDNGIAIREGVENTGTMIDSFAWGDASNIFVETSPYSTNHVGGEYYSRINNQDTNNNSQDFEILSHVIAPICGNNLIESGETCDDGNAVSGDGCSATCQTETDIISVGDVRINELVSDPETGDEWIELYNTTTKTIDLTNWTIEDGSNTKTILSGTIGFETATKFFVITKPKGALNNAGDIISLKNADGDIIDTVTYGDWDDGDLTNNAPVAENPSSLARANDGESTHDDKNDFKITSTLTKGTANIITTPETDNDEEAATTNTYDYSKDITLSEIFPNPKGADNEATNGEFIELFNKGQTTVNLSNWRIEVNDNVLTIPSGTMIGSQQYLSFLTKNILALINDGATVKLFQPLRQTSYQSITYKKALEDQAYALFDLSSWQWTSRATREAVNFLASPPSANFEIIDEPIINQTIRFDSSDSFLGNKTASYHWSFADGSVSNLANPSHNFTKLGKTKISLTIKTDYGISTVTKTITIINDRASEPLNRTEGAEYTEVANQNGLLNNIIITDLLANPEGADAGKEWIKIKNNSESEIDLKNYKIINEANKTIGAFKESYIINSHEEKEINNKVLTGSLGNSKQTVSLIDPTGKVISSLSYDETIEGKSYLENNSNNEDLVKIASTPINNEIFTTSGIAISAPGIFSKQSFYFLPEFGEPLYEIYNSKKLFPKLKAGDQLIVSGTYEEKETGPRLKTKETEDIQIIGSEEILVPSLSTSAEIKLAPYPRLALVEGEVVTKKSPRIYLADASGEIEIYLTTGTKLKTADFTIGDRLSIFGVLNMVNGVARLMPRSADDIRKIEPSDFSAASLTTPNSTTNTDIVNTPTTPRKKIIFYYLIAGGFIILSGVFYLIHKTK